MRRVLDWLENAWLAFGVVGLLLGLAAPVVGLFLLIVSAFS